MITAKCIAKLKLNNKICEYKLITSKEEILDLHSEYIKKAIEATSLAISNLKLTSDGRLINISNKKKKLSKDLEDKKQHYINTMLKAKVLNKYKRIPLLFGQYCEYFQLSSTEHIIYIPDDVVFLKPYIRYNEFDNIRYPFAPYTEIERNLKSLNGNLIMIGGNSLIDINDLFDNCEFDSLDLSLLNTSNVLNMENTFRKCNVKHLDISTWDTSRVRTMRGMFRNCKINESLNLNNFDTSNVEDVIEMFHKCKAKEIDITSFKLDNLRKWGKTAFEVEYPTVIKRPIARRYKNK